MDDPNIAVPHPADDGLFLWIWRPTTRESEMIARGEITRDEDVRYDLHPRWDRHQRWLAFDSVHKGSRQVYALDASPPGSRSGPAAQLPSLKKSCQLVCCIHHRESAFGTNASPPSVGTLPMVFLAR